MMGSAAAVAAEFAGGRYLVSLDKAHKLEIRRPGVLPSVVESRPVTEFAAAVDNSGRLHIAAWLLSRHLMYYTSHDGDSFTRSTLLKSDGALRLKDCLIHADSGVAIVYVAETEHADTLVCYRNDGVEWEGRRAVEVQHPQRLTALQFDGVPGGAGIIYSVKDGGRTTVYSRPAGGNTPPDTIATIAGGLTDFCTLTTGAVRQTCWVSDGLLMINGLRQSEEPWSQSWPYLKRVEGGVQCLWLQGSSICGVMLGGQRLALQAVQVRDALPCMLALPGELRRSIVEASTLREIDLLADMPDWPQTKGQPRASGRQEGGKAGGGQSGLTLADVVRNQAVYITRMQDSLSAMERNMIRMQAEVNRLNSEMAAVLRTREQPRPVPQFRVAAAKVAPESPEMPPEPEAPEPDDAPGLQPEPETVAGEMGPT